MMTYYNRRQFLTRSALGMTAGAAALSGLGSMNAFAADLTGYKALVCINLKGGMDHGDTVLPTDAASHADLRAIRSTLFDAYDADDPTSSRHLENIRALNPSNASEFGGQSFGLPVELDSLRQMFNAGECAIVGSVGPLIEPTDQMGLELGTSRVPVRLFSHNDQQSTWMAQSGWGGRFAKATALADRSANPNFMAVTATSLDVFLAGAQAQQFRAPTSNNNGGISIAEKRWRLGYSDADDLARERLSAYYAQSDRGEVNPFRRDVTAGRARGLALSKSYAEAREELASFTVEFPNSDLGRQLKAVAEAIALREVIGVRRQVFYCATGGFDTHDSQHNDLPNLHENLAACFAAFRSALIEIGQWNSVTAFTMSDFGRTLIGNNGGTDHGWGSHHFVMGGAVRGKAIYGAMPRFDGRGSRYTEERGRLIPSVSVEQYAATLGGWFGLDSTELNAALPNLSRFDTADLGFMGQAGA